MPACWDEKPKFKSPIIVRSPIHYRSRPTLKPRGTGNGGYPRLTQDIGVAQHP